MSDQKEYTETDQSKNQNKDDKGQFVVTPRTPGHLEEELVEKMLDSGMPEVTSSEIERDDSCLHNSELVRWRSKTNITNKFHLNMKRTLNPKIKNETIINVEEYNSDEDTKSKET